VRQSGLAGPRGGGIVIALVEIGLVFPMSQKRDMGHPANAVVRGEEKDFAGERFRSGHTKGGQREGVSTVNLNHPLAANFREAGELCGSFNMYS
jgi:hypothetical protein